MDPLTPNTTAFLSYLSSTLEGNDNNSVGNNNNHNNNNNTHQNAPAKFDPLNFNPFEFTSFSAFDPSKSAQNMNGQQPASLPPSAFFPIPGRDTPEDTPPSTNEASQSPEKPAQLIAPNVKGLNTSAVVDASGESEGESPRRGGRRASNHKRKAGLGVQKNRHVEDDEDDEDEDSDSGDGHEDKRVHQANQGASGPKKGGRKSTGGEDGKGGKESKAARRKEQNRAAQKAFRERREAKVKDLEDKVAELERKSYGTSVENENLRGILKRLQEENVALRQAAFTFSMPVNGAPQSAPSTGASTPFASAQPQRQQSKPPSPPNSAGDDVLRSINDVPAAQPRKSSGAVAPSPDSVASVRSGSVSTNDSSGPYRPVNLFSEPSHAFDVAAVGGRPQMTSHSSSDSNTNTQDTPRSVSGISPASTSTNGRTELDALWASFLQQGAPQKDQSQAWNMNKPTAFGQLENQPNPMSFVNNNAKVGATGNTNNWDKLAFRDTSATVQQAPHSQGQQQVQMGVQAPANPPQADPWSGMMDNSMDDFLASLTGANTAGLDNDAGANDDDFNAQLQQILGSNNASPSNAFDLPGMNPFSPTNYLNMSPSPLNSVSASNEPSPQTNSGSSASASASPESLVGINEQPTRGSSVDSAVATMGPPKVDGESLYVLDEKGRVIKPSELWIRMGMQHESNLEHLLIDDLCDMMRAKATCKDGKAYIQASDAENMFKYKGPDPVHDARLRAIEQRAGIAPGAFTAPRR